MSGIWLGGEFTTPIPYGWTAASAARSDGRAGSLARGRRRRRQGTRATVSSICSLEDLSEAVVGLSSSYVYLILMRNCTNDRIGRLVSTSATSSNSSSHESPREGSSRDTGSRFVRWRVCNPAGPGLRARCEGRHAQLELFEGFPSEPGEHRLTCGRTLADIYYLITLESVLQPGSGKPS